MPAQQQRKDPLPLALPAGPACLRRLRPGDLPAFQAYRGDTELGRYQGWAAQSDADALAFLEEMNRIAFLQAGEWTQVAIAHAATDALLGDLGLFVDADQRAGEIGFTLARGAQGAGVATAAVRAAIALMFAHTPVARIRGVTDARNTASIRLLERVGMRRVESRATVFNGEACIELVYCAARDGSVR